MSYQALYRKYRPFSFDGVVGQPHIVRTLKNQMKSGRISHAYLFCGTRGTGKTSTAKIFAKAINCLTPKEGEPCGECILCAAIAQNRSMNVIEIDAASNNGVDNIREIREEVKYPPTEGRYKVYIIDEVHMLSQGAFNALLKTLEEPPEHVVFILATTDPQKVPATILSRCQRFDFRRISMEEITGVLKKYLQEEGISAEETAVSYVARMADGSMRDALSILDQCISFYYGEEITIDKVLEVLGAVDDSVLFDMADSLFFSNAQRAMELVEKVVLEGREIGQFVLKLIGHFRNLLLVLSLEKPETVLDISSESVSRLREQVKGIGEAELLAYIRAFSELNTSLRYAGSSRILLEVLLLKLCSPVKARDCEELAARLAALERNLADGNFRREPVQAEKLSSAKKESTHRSPALSEDKKKAVALWQDICSTFSMPLKGELHGTELDFFKGDTGYILCESAAQAKLLEKKLPQIMDALSEKLEKTVTVLAIDKAQALEREADSEENTADTEDELEFLSLAGSYLPDAEVE